jgi:predicted nucleic acid-binding protein
LPTAKILVDTQFVIALINPRDIDHGRAVHLAREHRHQSFLITDAVLLEIGNALARTRRKEAAEVIESFFRSDNMEVIRMTPDLFSRALDLYRRRWDKNWSLVDCVSFVVMQDRGSRRALTSDHHFIQAGFEAMLA